MITTLSRIIKYGIKGFLRNGWLSMATISVIALALMVFESLLIFNVITKTAVQSLQDKIDISIYFKAETPEDDILKAQRSLESVPEIKSVEYVSRDKALEIFKSRYADNPAILQSVDELQQNPLLASLDVKAKNSKDYQIIASYLENAGFKNWFEKVTYAQNAVVIERLNRIVDTAERGGFVIILVLAAVAVLITFNTIRLAIYSSRDEIGIMRLVGASNSFIRGPYVVEGIFYGIISAIVSFIIFIPVMYLVSPHVKVFIPEMDIWKYFGSHFAGILGLMFLFGCGLGIISSVIALRKYLDK